MKFTAHVLSVLAAGGLLIGAIGSAPALADKKAEPTIFDLIDKDLKALDKALFGTPKKK